MEFDANIIKWYPFDNQKTILQIGQNENISTELKNRCEKLVVYENDIGEKFDYILIYGYQGEKIEKYLKNLTDDGKILIIGKNETGINNFDKYVENNENIGINRIEKHNEKLLNINQIEKNLKDNNFNTNIFYVFPNYSGTEVVINEKFRTQKAHIEKYCPDINENEVRIFDEIKALKTIIYTDEKLLKIFANAFFIEASAQEIKNDIRYCSFNNSRKAKYRLITIIKDNIVEKVPVNDEANQHITNMCKIAEDIKITDIDILDYTIDGRFYSKLIKDERTLDRILYDNRQNLDEIVKILTDLKNILIQYSTTEIPDEIQSKYSNCENLHFLKNAYWDMIAKNCFYINGRFVFFDQEWEKEYLPVEFLIYRSIINSYDLVRKINVENLLEKLDILQYRKNFEQLDLELREEILDEQVYNEIYNKNITSIDNILYDNKIVTLLKEDNANKQKYISELEEDNKKKQEYIDVLENNLEQIKKELEEQRKKGFFWKGK